MYQYILAIHIIFVICYMAGLFYMVRLFIYHTEAQAKPEPDRTILSKQFEIMESKLWWIITIPSAILVLVSAITMLILIPGYLQQPWLHIKLTFVLAMLVYQQICQNKMTQMRNGIFKWTSTQLRIWNEVATILLFAIVFLAVLKNAVNWIYGVVGLIVFTLIIMSAVKIYKYFREKDSLPDNPELKKKIIKINDDIEIIVRPLCDEKFNVGWYGAYYIDPKYLVFWISVQSDLMKKHLSEMPGLLSELRATLQTGGYPSEAQEFVHIGFESQETVDRESNGDWFLHFK